jgi:hypothetical protein
VAPRGSGRAGGSGKGGRGHGRASMFAV